MNLIKATDLNLLVTEKKTIVYKTNVGMDKQADARKIKITPKKKSPETVEKFVDSRAKTIDQKAYKTIVLPQT